MITTSGMLARKLLKGEDDFISMILNVDRVSDFVDGPTSHRYLNVRTCGERHIEKKEVGLFESYFIFNPLPQM